LPENRNRAGFWNVVNL